MILYLVQLRHSDERCVVASNRVQKLVEAWSKAVVTQDAGTSRLRNDPLPAL
jgi:hypothetical protein